MVILKATKDSEAGVPPTADQIAGMVKFNEEMVKAGVLLDAGGLYPSSTGARVRFSRNKATVIDGPFTETKELVAGYWLIQAKSKEEAIEWVKRLPGVWPEGTELEIRRAVEGPPELEAEAARLRTERAAAR
jgi:hypothetical protein